MKDIVEMADPSIGIKENEFKNVSEFLKNNKLKLTEQEKAKLERFLRNTAFKAGMSEENKRLLLEDFIRGEMPQLLSVVKPRNE